MCNKNAESEQKKMRCTYSLAGAKVIDSNDMEPLADKVTDLIAPSVPEVGESVDKDHCLVVRITLLDVIWEII